MKYKSIISLLMRIAIAVIFIQTLYYKFTAHPDSVFIFSQLGAEPYGRIGLGVTELITAILLLIPRTKVYAILLSFGIICGAIASHLWVIGAEIMGDGGGLFILAIVVFTLCIVLLYLHWQEVNQVLRFTKAKMLGRMTAWIFLCTSVASGCAQHPNAEASSQAHRRTTIQPNDSAMNISDAEWKKRLTPEQYYVLRQKGTEYAHTGAFVLTKDKGTYSCAGCGEPLFTDDMKFESHCGWPSFDREVAGGKIIQTDDYSAGMHRTEISCARCGGHLGHIFDDGPTATGERYCVNSASLSFEPAPVAGMEKEMPSLAMITLGGGCFWCIEAVFEQLKGVTLVESGYSGGWTAQPSYREVCDGNTGHAEVVQITYDPQLISLTEILEVFFTVHDPTTMNRQGADVGTQYRSAIFYHTEDQRKEAWTVIDALDAAKVYTSKIVTEVAAYKTFYKAEQYHQEYYELHKEEPYCKAVILPKMDKLHKVFSSKLKKQ